MKPDDSLSFCQSEIDRMLARSQTKVIFPLITLGLLSAYLDSGQDVFTDNDIRRLYEKTVGDMKSFLGHDLHIGGKYYDAYPSRNLPKYGVLKVLAGKRYRLLSAYKQRSQELSTWIPQRIAEHIGAKLTIIPKLSDREYRVRLSESQDKFMEIIHKHISQSPTDFEIFCFAIIKVHLEKFACKVYRDTRTSAHDRGVDISTDFGVVYQIKKLKIVSKKTAEDVYADLKANFDRERLTDGKVILVIDDITKTIKNYLIDMKVQSLNTSDLLRLAAQFDEPEDREKVLRVVSEEFRREYASDIGRKGLRSY